MSKSWVVYILECKNGSLYTGITNNLERRIEEHKNGNGSAYTSAFGVQSVVYTEQVDGRSEALKREAAIKKLEREKKEKLIQ